MIRASKIHPDRELRDYLTGKIHVGNDAAEVPVYGDFENPTNGLADDFVLIENNGDVQGKGKGIDFASGYLILSLYCRLNDDGSIKGNRIDKLLAQLDNLIEGLQTEHCIYHYDVMRYFTPTTQDQTSGYSFTSLNLTWHTINK